MSQAPRLSPPGCPSKPDVNNSLGGLGGQCWNAIESSEISPLKNTPISVDLEALHSKGLSHPQTNHVLRRVSPFWMAYDVSLIDSPCEARFLTIQPPVMTKDFT